MSQAVPKVGIISCSGEELAEGTISRLAARRVLEGLRPQQTVTLCLPLFLAGEPGERQFAKEHPTITVDGCSELCAKRGTEQHSGRVSRSLVVSDILGDRVKACHRSARDANEADEQAVWIVAERIAAEVDTLIASRDSLPDCEIAPSANSARCACGAPAPGGTVEIRGTSITINGLSLIFEHMRRKGLDPNGNCGDTLLATVRIYHFIDASLEEEYEKALVGAYRIYCERVARASI